MEKIKRKNYLLPFILLFVFITSILTILNISITYYEIIKFNEETIKSNLKKEINYKVEQFDKNLNEQKAILNTINNSLVFKDYIENNTNKNYINDLFLSLIKSNSDIMQLRYIDENGYEKIRLDRTIENEIIKISENNLQNKANRYYFKDTIALKQNQYFISNLDLNIENGKVEIPHKPTLRIATKVQNQNDINKGILIVNIYMKKQLESLVSSEFFNTYIYDDKNNIIFSNNKKYLNFEKYISKKNEIDFLKNNENSKLLLEASNEKVYLSLQAKAVKDMTNSIVSIILEIIIFSIPISIILAYFLSKIPKRLFDKLEEEHDLILYQSKQNAISDMIVMIAHQWRQPLTVISLIAQEIIFSHKFDMLDKKTSEKLGNQLLGKIDQLSLSIDEFRDFFKQNENKLEVNLVNTIEDLKNIVSSNLNESGIKLNVNTLNETIVKNPFKIKTFKSKFNQVIINLISNSINAIENNCEIGDLRTINIDLIRKENSIKVVLEDSGKGIEEKHLSKIFDPYFSTNKKILQGKGLGLYFVKSLVETHFDGTIKAENGENGAKFTITIPISGF